MEFFELIQRYGWQSFVAVDLVVFVIVLYFIRERSENKRIQGMQTDQVSLEQRTNEKNEVTEKFQPKNPSKTPKTIFSAGQFSATRIGNAANGEIMVTAAMIQQLKSFHTANPLLQKLVKMVIPEQYLESLVEKALKEELSPGMKVSYRNGQLEIK